MLMCSAVFGEAGAHELPVLQAVGTTRLVAFSCEPGTLRALPKNPLEY